MANTNKFACGFCKKAFTRERTLGAHMCEKKRRHLDRNNKATISGLMLFQRWHEMQTATKTPKSMNEFIDSPYYKAFIKFARHMMDLQPVDPDRFRDYVFRHVRNMDRDWCKDSVYEAYIVDHLSKEPVQRGLERSILTIAEWSEKNNTEWETFFTQVSPSEAVHLIQMGKLSPWVFYLAKTSDSLWDRISDEQYLIIDSVIDMDAWMKRFQIKKDDVTWARKTLRDHNI